MEDVKMRRGSFVWAKMNKKYWPGKLTLKQFVSFIQIVWPSSSINC